MVIANLSWSNLAKIGKMEPLRAQKGLVLAIRNPKSKKNQFFGKDPIRNDANSETMLIYILSN